MLIIPAVGGWITSKDNIQGLKKAAASLVAGSFGHYLRHFT